MNARHFAACIESARIETLAGHIGFAGCHLRTALDRIDAADIAGARAAIVETLKYIGESK